MTGKTKNRQHRNGLLLSSTSYSRQAFKTVAPEDTAGQQSVISLLIIGACSSSTSLRAPERRTKEK